MHSIQYPERQRSAASAVVLPAGLVLALLGIAMVEAPLAARILAVAPLLVAPRLLHIMPTRSFVGGLTTRDLAGWPCLLAAAPLPGALAVPGSAAPVATALTAPWLAFAACIALAAVRHRLPRMRQLAEPDGWADVAADAALGFLAVGAAFLSLWRLGIRPLGFPDVVVLLTAVHFHFAAFGLLALLAILAARRRSRFLGGAALAFAAGMPVTALGWILDSPWLHVFGATAVAVGGLSTAVALAAAPASIPRRLVGAAAALALAAAVPLGLGWSIAGLLRFDYLDLDAMIRLHGTLNAAAVVAASLAVPDGREAG